MNKVLMTAIVTSLVVGPLSYKAAVSKPEDTYKQLDLYADVFEIVRNKYFRPVTDEQLIEASLSGMVSSLDPHSSYMNPKEYADLNSSTIKGEFGGLGMQVTEENGIVKVESPMDDTPAARANIKPGDLITHIDGEPVVGIPLDEAVGKMRGNPGTPVKLIMRHDIKGDPFELTLVREIIKVLSVQLAGRKRQCRLYPHLNLLRTDTAWTGQGDRRPEKPVGRQDGRLCHRPAQQSGRLGERGGVRLEHLPGIGGDRVHARPHTRMKSSIWTPRPGLDKTKGVPVVILINGGTASAAEIVSGALQDHHRAIIMGTQSFGKGSVQTIMPLKNEGGLRLTTAEYFTPRPAGPSRPRASHPTSR